MTTPSPVVGPAVQEPVESGGVERGGEVGVESGGPAPTAVASVA
ncbi:hypothetical protein AB0368_12710 [Actinoplanes sp. NPDC051475]